jgi:hypothetical protein
MGSRWQNHTRTDLAKFAGYLSKDSINVLCPAGIGDLYWIYSKLHVLKDGAIFWFPGEENRRAGQLADILGIRYGYLPGLTTDFVWSQPGNDTFGNRQTIIVQANRHLESGKPLHDWYPEIHTHYPQVSSGFIPPAKKDSYVCVFTCSKNYMGGQLHSTVWANMIKCIIHSTGSKVALIGAGSDVELLREIKGTYHSFNDHVIEVYDRPLTEVFGWIQHSRAFIGVASGLSIIATSSLGVPVITGYPRHLDKLPGTFEPETSAHDWVFLDQLPDYIFNYKHNDLIQQGGIDG